MFSLLYANEVQGINVRNIEVYSRPPERVDIMLAFDAPYVEDIQQETKEGYETIILKNTAIQQEETKSIKALGIEAIQITQLGNDVYIILLNKEPINIQASKIVDGYGLRFRVTTKPNKPVDRIKEGLKSLSPTE